MKIKIVPENAVAIDEAVAPQQQRARVNLVDAQDVLSAMRRAEAKLDALGIPKRERSGASFYQVPAGPSANSYSYAQGATAFRIARATTDWYLIDVQRIEVYPKQREREDLTLTPEQDDKAIDVLRRKYLVARAA
ncbi:hypothetical protein [Noviherbaspirillum malthae]|uniref:hypothetical protein n=1 Tax=Noviherbaspirillum malthae TaxID=1260987 RepID=UPI0018903499|nr:hypothetical protein [Noviherbaspirillum malthae]